MRFERAYSQTSWTIPSVISLFTSLHQEQHGVLEVDQRLSDDVDTLAELFQDIGYRTEALIQNGTVGSKLGLERGFERLTRPGEDWQSPEELFAAVRETLLAEHDRPLFLYAHVLPPHMPYEPPESFEDRYDPHYVIFRESPIDESDEHRPGVNLDYDRQGFLVSVEVLEASKRVQEPTSVIVTTDEG